jgi:hypothetical protein
MDEKFSVLFWTEFQVGELKFQVKKTQPKGSLPLKFFSTSKAGMSNWRPYCLSDAARGYIIKT